MPEPQDIVASLTHSERIALAWLPEDGSERVPPRDQEPIAGISRYFFDAALFALWRNHKIVARTGTGGWRVTAIGLPVRALIGPLPPLEKTLQAGRKRS